MDIAIWQKMTVYPGHIERRTYEPTDLEEFGYSYEYLSPDNFDLPAARVMDGILAPDAQAFKLLVVRRNDSLTLEGVSKLVEFANAGLPLIFAGGTPSTVLGTLAPTVLRQAQRDLQTISRLPNVHLTDSYLVASTASTLGIQPLTKVSANGSWYTYWRFDPSNNIDYVFIYNDAMHTPQGQGASEGTIEFKSTKVPFEYNAWTGETRPILTYTSTNTSTIIPFRLAGNQSTIVAFHPHNGTATSALIQPDGSSANILGYDMVSGKWVLQVGGTAVPTPSTSNTKSPAAVPLPSFILSNWSLTVEHWDPPTDLYNYTYGALKHNTTHILPSLVPWLDIPGLQNVSGRGYYSTSFKWLPTSNSSSNATAHGAFIDFGFVYHTLRVFVNGNRLPPLDVTQARADIKDYLIEGENTVQAIVATPLGNVLRPIWGKLMSSGEGPASPDAGPKNGFIEPPQGKYGLLADVAIIPYVEVEVG